VCQVCMGGCFGVLGGLRIPISFSAGSRGAARDKIRLRAPRRKHRGPWEERSVYLICARVGVGCFKTSRVCNADAGDIW